MEYRLNFTKEEVALLRMVLAGSSMDVNYDGDLIDEMLSLNEKIDLSVAIQDKFQ